MKQFLAVLILTGAAISLAATDFVSCTNEALQRRDQCLVDAMRNGVSAESCYVNYENAWEVCGYLYTQRRASVGALVNHKS